MNRPSSYLHLTPFSRNFIIGISVCITSQLYFTLWAEGFRLSASAIFFPLLLLTLKRESHRPSAGLVTAGCVILFRVSHDLFRGIGLLSAVYTEVPGGIFYLCYDALLCLMLRDRRSYSFRHVWFSLYCCDLISNMVNFALSSHLSTALTAEVFMPLAWMALFRATAAVFLLWAAKNYRQLLFQQEHELRYRRLFLMTANLKTELYFLKKDAEEVEQVMARAYKLYEKLEQAGAQDELRELALSIARDVHEVKKDNLRIIRGLEEEIAETYDHEVMSMRDLLNILSQSTRQMLGEQRSEIRLECFCPKNIPVREHYRVLSVLKNLVTNAVEAIQAASGTGCVRVEVHATQDILTLTVSDNGPGISSRKQKLLFKVGYSTKFNPDTGNISRGVGLPAVQYIVEELGGTLNVTSEQGSGTTFRIELPVDQVTGGNT